MLVKTLALYEAVTGLNQMAQHANMNVKHENIHPTALFKMIFWCCGYLIKTSSLECDIHL
jgi:hypothetical protein